MSTDVKPVTATQLAKEHLSAMSGPVSAWVVLVTDGLVLEVAPEVFLDKRLAKRCAENWAWFLSSGGEFRIERPFEGRHRVGHRDVRLVQTHLPETWASELWVGTHWTKDGYPDPEATLLAGSDAARAWATAALAGKMADEVQASRWHVAATFRYGDEESNAVAYAGKFITRPPLRT